MTESLPISLAIAAAEAAVSSFSLWHLLLMTVITAYYVVVVVVVTRHNHLAHLLLMTHTYVERETTPVPNQTDRFDRGFGCQSLSFLRNKCHGVFSA